MVTDFIGFIGGACTTLSFIPQVLLVWRSRSTKDISLGMYSVFVLGVFLWLIFGVMTKSWPIVISNMITLFLSGSILFMKIKAGQ